MASLTVYNCTPIKDDLSVKSLGARRNPAESNDVDLIKERLVVIFLIF